MVHVGKDKYIFSDGEENNRRLSVKEIARIQTFPDWYKFSRGTNSRNDNAKLDLVYKQIGNAVPVRLALAVAEPIAEFAKTQLEQEKEDTKYVIVHETEKRMMAQKSNNTFWIESGDDMQDFSSVNIKNMIIHNVGNKVKGESLDLSTEICDTNNKVTNQYLKQFFFSTFKFDITYRFVHETDIAMNEIYNYVKHIFDNSDQFYEQSVNIAKHLYEVSVHPNIKAGELCIVYLQNCIIDDNVTDAVGIYKSESKDYYLQVNSTENGYDIECQQGINPKKLDKGCLIFNSSDSNYKVCVVDKNVNDAMYWKKLFLMIEEEKNEYANTSKALKSCKRYIAKNEDLEPEKKLELINNSVEYFENNDEFDLEKFSEKVFNNKEESDKFKVYLDSYEIDNKFSISSNAVTKIKKTIKG